MQTNINKTKNSEVKLAVELNARDLKKYLEEAGQELSASLTIDGFRSGKAPLDVLRKKVGDQKVLEVALDIAVRGSLAQALKQEKLEIISFHDLKVKENTAEKLKYTVELVLFPEVKIGRYQDLGLIPKTAAVEDKEIEEALQFVRRSRAVYQESDAPAQKGQKVEVDFEVKDKGQLIEGGKSENHPLTLGNGGFIPGFEEQLLGMKKGETKEFPLEVPADYYQKTIAGKKLDFTVTLKSAKAEILPELTDQFAQSLGSFDALDNLKESIKQGLQQEKEEKERQKLRLEILEKIDKDMKVDLPGRLVEEQLDVMLADFDHHLHEKGMELSLYLAQIKKTQEQLREEWRTKAEKQIRQSLILRTVGRAENIQVEESEVGEAVNALAAQLLQRGEEKEAIDVEKLRMRVQTSLLNEKIFQFLEKANIQT